MAAQNCPKCGSDRVRRGYLPTSIFSKLFFRYNLLCDNCNWEFKGFAIPGTVSSKPTRNPNKRRDANTGGETETSNVKQFNSLNPSSPENYADESSSEPQNSQRVRKKVKVRL